MSQLIRKLKRNKKTAYKFGFKLTYHEITLTHDQEYAPSALVIRWSRGHRQVVSTKAIWTPGTQPNGNGQLCGNGVFDPPCTVELLVTLYKEHKSEAFEEKDYKFVLEDEGDLGGRKALGVFSINIGQFANMLGSSNDVTMEMKSLVKKVSEALVDVTIKSDFLKTGKVGDDDMMSTWSAMSGMVDSEVDDEPLDPAESPSGVQPLLENSNSEQNLGASRNLKESLSFFDMKPAESYYDFMQRNAPDGAIDSQGVTISLEHLKNAKTIGLFFAANSSPQCKFFLSTLDSFYNSLYEVRPGDFELLFVSCDYNDAEMLDFMQDSGVCYPGIKPTSILAEALKEKFEISNIPEVIVINPQTGELVDKDGRVKIERCGGNEDCFEVIDHWIAGRTAPLRAEIELKLHGQLSEDSTDQKAKIVSKEEKKRQEKLEKERKKKEEEERRRKDRLEKDEKKKVEREEKKKQRDKEKSEKRAKRSSTALHADTNTLEQNAAENGEIEYNEPLPELEFETLDLESKGKPTLFELAGGHSPTPKRHEIAEPEAEPEIETPSKKKEKEKVKEKEKDKEESSIFKLSLKGTESQLKEAKSRITELEQSNKNMNEKHETLHQAKVQLENEKDDLQEKVIELNHNIEDFTEQVRELTENRDNLTRENQEKSQQVDSLQEERLGLREDLNGARNELESIRQQLSQSKLKLIEYETDKQAKDEERQELLAATELQGWLFKRGVRGVTGKKWRRRFFHMGQGFKLYYYKTSSMQLPQGYIDLEKVKNVVKQSEDKQDKTNASFNIEVDGRVFELLAQDVSMRDQWINAVRFLVEYRGKYKVDVNSLSAKGASTDVPAGGNEVSI